MDQQRRIVTAVGAGLLALLALVAVLLMRSGAETEEQVVRERVTLARAAALVVDVFIRDNVAGVEQLGRDAAALDDGDPAELSAYLTRAAELHPSWDGVGLVDSRGLNVTVTAQTALRSFSVADRDYFRNAMATSRTALSQAVIGRVSGKPTVVIAVPVTMASGERGVLTGVLSLAFLEVELRALPGGAAVGIVVVDGAGHAIVHPDPAKVARLEDLSALPGVRAALAGETGSLRRVEGSEELVIAHAPARTPGWGVVVQQPSSVAFALIRSEIAQAAAIAVAGALLVLALAWVVARRLQRYYDDAVASRERAEAATLESERGRRRLEELIAQREEFLGNVGHELKTPLTSVSLAAELVARHASATPEARRYVGLMRQQIARAVTLIGDLLDISRFDRGVPMRRDAVDLSALAHAVVERQRDLLPERAEFDLREDLEPGVVVEGDEARLEQVLTNLLSNAVKYSPSGGRIDIRVASEGGRGVLTIVDSGIGMTPDEREAIFTPFARGKRATERGIEGTGLGLYLAKRIVDAHGGRISVASVPGSGTTVAVDLPLGAGVVEATAT